MGTLPPPSKTFTWSAAALHVALVIMLVLTLPPEGSLYFPIFVLQIGLAGGSILGTSALATIILATVAATWRLHQGGLEVRAFLERGLVLGLAAGGAVTLVVVSVLLVMGASIWDAMRIFHAGGGAALMLGGAMGLGLAALDALFLRITHRQPPASPQ